METWRVSATGGATSPRELPPTTDRGAITKRRIALIVVGVVVALLGLLWMLQGAGVVHVRPILCVSNCKPVTKSVSWLILGALALSGGVALAGWNARKVTD